jgi:hypothetical protein
MQADGPERSFRSAWCDRCCPTYASERPWLGGCGAHEERRWNALVSHQLIAAAEFSHAGAVFWWSFLLAAAPRLSGRR